MSDGGSSRTVVRIAVAIVVAVALVAEAVLLTRGGSSGRGGSTPSAGPVASATPSASPSYSAGMSSTEVIQLRRGLAAYGFSTAPVDGIYGPQTMDAVKKAQTKLGVTPDGIWGRDVEGLPGVREAAERQEPAGHVRDADAGRSRRPGLLHRDDRRVLRPGHRGGREGLPERQRAAGDGEFDAKTVDAIDAAMKNSSTSPTPSPTST